MGNDGGTIFGRKDKVKTKKKDCKQSNINMQKNIARYCSLSKEPLQRPVVLDKKGNIFNKEAILKAIIEKKIPFQFEHIKKLKDLKEVKEVCFSKDSEFKIQCCLTKKSFTGISPFLMIWKCGCVYSLDTFRKLNFKFDQKYNSCSNCNEKFKQKHLVFFKVLKNKEKYDDNGKDKIPGNSQIKKINIDIPENVVLGIKDDYVFKKELDNLFHKNNNDKKFIDSNKILLSNFRNGIR
jgi:hypothetical protein